MFLANKRNYQNAAAGFGWLFRPHLRSQIVVNSLWHRNWRIIITKYWRMLNRPRNSGRPRGHPWRPTYLVMIVWILSIKTLYYQWINERNWFLRDTERRVEVLLWFVCDCEEAQVSVECTSPCAAGGVQTKTRRMFRKLILRFENIKYR